MDEETTVPVEQPQPAAPPDLTIWCDRCKEYQPASLTTRNFPQAGIMSVFIHCPSCGLIAMSGGIVPLTLLAASVAQPSAIQTAPQLSDLRHFNRADRRRMGLS